MAVKNRLRVVEIIDSLHVGGAQRQLLTVLRNMDRSRFDPFVLCLFSAEPLAQECADLGIPVSTLGMRKTSDAMWVIPKITRYLLETEADVVHTHTLASNTYGRLAARIAGTKYIFSSEHNTYFWKQRRHILMDYLLSKITSRIVAVSRAVRDFTSQQEAISSDKFIVIYNPVDVKEFAPNSQIRAAIRTASGLDERQKVIVTVGRLVEQKGYPYLLEAAAVLFQTQPDVCFWIVGDGPQKQMLHGEVERLGLAEHVHFLGQRQDVPHILAAADLFVLASAWEGFGIVIPEAMATELPVVATRVGGIPEIITHGEDGILVPSKDAEALAGGMSLLLEDQNLARRMARKARSTAERRFSVSVIIPQFEALYEGRFEALKQDS